MHDYSNFINRPFHKSLSFIWHNTEIRLIKTFLLRCDKHIVMLLVWALFFPVTYWYIEVKLLLFITCYIFDSILLIRLVCANDGLLKRPTPIAAHTVHDSLCTKLYEYLVCLFQIQKTCLFCNYSKLLDIITRLIG